MSTHASVNDALSGRGNVRASSSHTANSEGDPLLEVEDEEVLHLARKNAHPRDAHISFFEADHRYEIKGVPAKRSVTSLVGIPFSKFDAKASAARIARRLIVSEGNGKSLMTLRNPRTPSDSQYCKMAVETKAVTSADLQHAVRSVWERSTHEGTRLHRAIELHLNGESIPDSYTAPEYRNHYLKDFQGYAQSEGFECYRTEWVIYSDEVSLAGSVDCVMRKRVGTCPKSGEPLYEYYIFDWKRSKRIYFKSFGNGGKRMGKGEPFNTLVDCNYSKYSLQLNVYRHILERDYGLAIKGLYLFVFHPWNDTFVKIEVPRLEKATQALFQIARPPVVVLIPQHMLKPSETSDEDQILCVTGHSGLEDIESQLGEDTWKRAIVPAIRRSVGGLGARVHAYVASKQCSQICIVSREVRNLNSVVLGGNVDCPRWSFALP